MKLVRILSIFMALAFLTGCAAAPAPIPSFKSITHVPTEQVIETIYISSINDKRDTKDMGASYFGTIRGGFGNPIERMHFSESASDFVKIHLARSLSKANYKITSKPLENSLTLRGSIITLWARNHPLGGLVGSREVEFNILMEIFDRKNNLIWKTVLIAADSDQKAAGTSGNSPIMEGWLAKLLQDDIFESVKSLNLNFESSLSNAKM